MPTTNPATINLQTVDAAFSAAQELGLWSSIIARGRLEGEQSRYVASNVQVEIVDRTIATLLAGVADRKAKIDAIQKHLDSPNSITWHVADVNAKSAHVFAGKIGCRIARLAHNTRMAAAMTPANIGVLEQRPTEWLPIIRDQLSASLQPLAFDWNILHEELRCEHQYLIAKATAAFASNIS